MEIPETWLQEPRREPTSFSQCWSSALYLRRHTKTGLSAYHIEVLRRWLRSTLQVESALDVRLMYDARPLLGTRNRLVLRLNGPFGIAEVEAAWLFDLQQKRPKADMARAKLLSKIEELERDRRASPRRHPRVARAHARASQDRSRKSVA